MAFDAATLTKISDLIQQLATYSDQDAAPDVHALDALVTDLFSTAPYPILYQNDFTNLYRVREGDDRLFFSDNHFFENASEFSINPDPARIGPGRCNFEQQQVFYCAFSEETAQYESISKFRGQNFNDIETPHIVYIGRWISMRVLHLADFSLRDESFATMEKFHPEYFELFKILIRLIDNLFIMPGNKKTYAITATISNFLMSRHDGLVYRSSQTNAHGVNLAVPRRVVDDGSIQFYNACRIRRHSYIKKSDRQSNRVDNWIGVPTEGGALTWFSTLDTLEKILRQQGKSIKYFDR